MCACVCVCTQNKPLFALHKCSECAYFNMRICVFLCKTMH